MLKRQKMRKDGRLQMQVSLGHDLEGKLIRKTVYGRTKDELEEKAVELRKRNRMGLSLADSEDTLKEYAEKWLKLYKETKELNTRTMYESILNNHIIPCLGGLKVKSITQKQVQEFYKIVAAKKLSKSSNHKIKITLEQIFKKAIENQHIYINPTLGAEMPKGKEQEEKRVLTDEEIDIGANLAEEHHAGILFLLMVYSGVRSGEAAALTWNDIKKDVIDVNKAVFWRKKQHPELKEPKTKSGRRKIPLIDPLKSYLEMKRKDKNKGAYLIEGKNGLITGSELKTMSNSFMKDFNLRLGGTDKKDLLSDITFYNFRHTYASILYDAGVDMLSAKDWMGHADVSTTLKIYTKLRKTKEKSSIEKLNAFISKQTETEE